MAIMANGKTIPTTEGSIIANNVKITKVNVVRNGVTTTVWESEHVHTDACYRICGGQMYTPYGTHYIHICRSCGHEWSNMYDAELPATAGEDCNDHGTCDNRILICGH